ncbi:hypothetical protein ACOSQ4_023583 [Xanthoceras sorbifolium]
MPFGGLQIATQFVVATWLAWRKRNLMFHSYESGGLFNFWVSIREFLELLGRSVISGKLDVAEGEMTASVRRISSVSGTGSSGLVASSFVVFYAGGSKRFGAAVSRGSDVGASFGGQSTGGLESAAGYDLGGFGDIKEALDFGGNFLVGSIVVHGGLRVGEWREVCPTISNSLGASRNCTTV